MFSVKRINKKLLVVLSFLALLSFIMPMTTQANASGVIGHVYSYPFNLPDADHVTYGHPIITSSKFSGNINLVVDSDNNTVSTDKYRVLTSSYYTGGNAKINMPVVQYFSSYYATSPVASFTYSKSRSVSNTKTYEKELQETISIKVGTQSGVQIDGFGVSSSAEVNATVSASVGFTNTIFVASETTESMTIPASSTQKYYMWEERANFDVYGIQVCEIQYKKVNERTTGMLWWKKTVWDWQEDGIKLVEDYYVYKFNGTGRFFGLFEYESIGGKFIYKGPKPDSSVLYI